MDEGDHLPIEIIDQDDTDELEMTSEQLQALERERKTTITFYRLFGILIIVLSSIIIPLVIVTYFYHPGQPDELALLIEQIIGYILAGFGSIIGSVLLISAKRIKNEPLVIVEPIANLVEAPENELEEK
ncbi:MAG: hypothetical protein ACTSQ0_00380 [Candidatus Heimdallarchaeota archaeon]